MARKTAQQRRIEALLQRQSAAVRKAFLEAMRKATNAVDRDALIRLLEANEVERAAALFRLERGVAFPLEEAIRNAFIGGGMAVADDLPKGLSGAFGFDGRHPRAIALAERQAAALVTYVSDDAVSGARKIIVDGLSRNRSLNSVARDLVGRKVGRTRQGGIIGLTEPQTDRMIRLRSMLSDPEQISDYFKDADMKIPRYKESDRRFDAMVRKAIKSGKALPAADVDRIGDAYKSKASGNRAKVVARNEAFTAQAAGREEAYQQLLDDGKVEAVTKKWQHGFSKEPREDHLRMDGETIDFDEVFVMDDGARMRFPHDPAGGPEHSISCRCTCVYRVKLPRD
ncbi:phage minor head protein [Nisaea sp.]|uniref:phage minor head protein n=2 Tax=Alphaproteobacteria TaxID=28211 RepID=UPI00329A2041